MRFLAEGPSIPDELLLARDDGRVIFFCGAGVSRARAQLPDFLGLAKKVTDRLGVPASSSARRLIDEADELALRVGESGLIPADRIFGILERQFVVRDIHAAVAEALKPGADADLSAHKVMLTLAKGPDDKVRLVTTNFDLLFEACDESVRYWKPPRLPDILRQEELNGIVHLHGRVNTSYSGPDGDGFILSSSEFGQAYLSEAWATDFISSIVEKYLIVFVGYSADDPPMQYLLEALNRTADTRRGVYAFQVGDHTHARSQWVHKGVVPIAYSGSANHVVLWETLSAWAERASDVDGWYAKTISLAHTTPEALHSHDRGQVAHVVSTVQGARRFASSIETPPAAWLCVFDPLVRYSSPHAEYDTEGNRSFIDPFTYYGLDSDAVPEKTSTEQYRVKREIPLGMWDGFAPTRSDQQEIPGQQHIALRGHLSTHVAELPSRLVQLAAWLAKVSYQPAALWWAAGQNGIHPTVQALIRSELEKDKPSASVDLRKTWRSLFEALDNSTDSDHSWFEVNRSIAADGWSDRAVRALAATCRPYLTVERRFGVLALQTQDKHSNPRRIVAFDVEHPKPHSALSIPNEYLLTATRQFRANLELAVILEKEVGGYALQNLVPIEPDPELKATSTIRSFGVAVPFLTYMRDYSRNLLN